MAKRTKATPGGTVRPSGTVGGGNAWSRRLLETFVAVAQTGSMSAAAEQLGLSQPAISQAVSALENATGTQLFDRTVRPPKLTLQAKSLLPYAIAVTESIERLEAALALDGKGQLPSLHIGMMNSFAATLGPYVINPLRDVALEWSVTTNYFNTRFEALTARRVDFIITADKSPAPPDIERMPILSEPFLLVLPKTYRKTNVLIKQVTNDLDMIRFGRDAYMTARLDRYLQEHGANLRSRYQFDTIDAALQMVASGLGWCLLTPLAVFRAIERGENIRVTAPPGRLINRTIEVACRRGEGRHVAEQIRNAAAAALRMHFLPVIAKTLGQAKGMIKIS